MPINFANLSYIALYIFIFRLYIYVPIRFVSYLIDTDLWLLINIRWLVINNNEINLKNIFQLIK